MSIVDIILLFCFVPAVFQGFRKGFIAQIISIVSIIAGIWASAHFADIASTWVAQYITASEQVMKLVSFALILVVVFLVLAAIGKILEGMFNLVSLGWLNKVLGLVFAMIKTGLLVGLGIMAFASINETFSLVQESVLNESVLYTPLKDLASEVFPYLKDLITPAK